MAIVSEQLKSNSLVLIPGIGPRMAEYLHELGFEDVSSLQRQNPEAMYSDLCRRKGYQLDKCVLYVFRCAVYFANTDNPDPRKLKWWHWKDAVS